MSDVTSFLDVIDELARELVTEQSVVAAATPLPVSSGRSCARVFAQGWHSTRKTANRYTHYNAITIYLQ